MAPISLLPLPATVQGMNSVRFVSEPAVDPDFSRFDSAESMYRDALQWGLADELRQLLCREVEGQHGDALRVVRDLVYELAGARNRDLAVDLLIHLAGLAEVGESSLRDYGRKHGCSHEWFRREAEAMRRRLGLPLRPDQRSESVREEYRLVNRRNGAS